MNSLTCLSTTAYSDAPKAFVYVIPVLGTSPHHPLGKHTLPVNGFLATAMLEAAATASPAAISGFVAVVVVPDPDPDPELALVLVSDAVPLLASSASGQTCPNVKAHATPSTKASRPASPVLTRPPMSILLCEAFAACCAA